MAKEDIEIEQIQRKIDLIKKKLLELRAEEKDTLEGTKKHYCCKDVCSKFKFYMDDIESKLLEIDKLAYKRFPLFVKYFAKARLEKGVSLKDYSEKVFNNPKDRIAFINSFHEQKKANELIKEKEELSNILNQIKDNDICECE